MNGPTYSDQCLVDLVASLLHHLWTHRARRYLHWGSICCAEVGAQGAGGSPPVRANVLFTIFHSPSKHDSVEKSVNDSFVGVKWGSGLFSRSSLRLNSLLTRLNSAPRGNRTPNPLIPVSLAQGCQRASRWVAMLGVGVPEVGTRVRASSRPSLVRGCREPPDRHLNSIMCRTVPRTLRPLRSRDACARSMRPGSGMFGCDQVDHLPFGWEGPRRPSALQGFYDKCVS